MAGVMAGCCRDAIPIEGGGLAVTPRGWAMSAVERDRAGQGANARQPVSMERMDVCENAQKALFPQDNKVFLHSEIVAQIKSDPELERIAGELVSRSEAVRMRMGAMSSSAPDTMKSIDRKALNDELQSELFDKLNDALQDSLTRAMTSSNAAKQGVRGRTIKQKIDMKTMAVYLPLIRENEKKAAEERLSRE